MKIFIFIFRCGFLLLAGGLIVIVIGILVGIYQPYDTIFKWKLKFGEDGEIFSLWEKPPVDLYIKIYLFNITNPNEYLAGKEKIKVEEVGPYVYKELMSHDDIVFNENGTVSTTPRHPLVWQEHLSEGRQENDTVSMLNIALLSIAQVAAEKSYLFRLPINLLIRQTKSYPIVKMTAREFMFGFETSLTTLGNTFLSDWIYFDKVGLIDRMYDFSDDFETFYTGETNSSISGLYDSYMGSKNLPQWDGEHCSNIEYASDGTKFKSFIEPEEKLKFFRKSMCRAQILVRDGNETVVDGFKAYKYKFEENAMDNGNIDERNKCYCRKGYCPPKGLLDVSDCYYGFPIALSYPHFMDCDESLIENVDGMKPNKSKHDSVFMVQPESGLPLQLSVKIQINMHFKDIRSMAHVERFSHQTVPMLWFDIELSGLPEPLKNRFNLYLNVLPHIDTLGFWLPIVGGILCVVCTVVQATLNLPQFISKTSKKWASTNRNHSYSKVLLRSGVYNACEVKLFEMNEKNKNNVSAPNQLIIDENKLLNLYSGKSLNNSQYNISEDEMCELNLNSSDNESNNDNENHYSLENEQAMSDCGYSCKSNFSSRSNSSHELSQNSNNVVIIVDKISDNESENSNTDRNDFDKEMLKNRLLHRNYSNNDNHLSIRKNSSASCLLGEASSSIEDIGNNKFTSSVNQGRDLYSDDDEISQHEELNSRGNDENSKDNRKDKGNRIFDPDNMI